MLASAVVLVLTIPMPARAQNPETRLDELEARVEPIRPVRPGGEFVRIERHRANFSAMLLQDPNVFGNMGASLPSNLPFELINQKYEEIESVGLSPSFDQLHAVVNIKLPYGYGGSICASGTKEYVRFYLSYDGGGTWEDQGMTSFTAWDIPGSKPLEYAVTLKIDPTKKWCRVENLPKVRAILSWNQQPPPGTPDHRPVWGDVEEVTVQIEPSLRWFLIEKFEEAKLVIPPELIEILAEPDLLPDPPELTPIELHELYAKPIGETHVPPLRYLQKQIHKLKIDPQEDPWMVAAEAPMALNALEIDWEVVLKDDTQADTKWEELVGVGLDTNTDTLVAVVKIKLPNGYSGNLCKAGSREYVAFWVDDGSGWSYIGTSSVRVHDLSTMPAEGVYYAAVLPWNIAPYRQPCTRGPKTLRIRGVLSWQVPPSTTDPGSLRTYGNREDTLVHITPGRIVTSKWPAPYIQTVGGMSVQDISAVTGLASGIAQTAGFKTYDSPFGGLVVISGHIGNAPDISDGATPLEYRISVSGDDGDTWEPVTNTFELALDQLLDGVWSALPKAEQSAPEGWYEYQEDLEGGPGNAQIFPAANTLARWYTGGRNGPWKIRLETRTKGTTLPVYVDAQDLWIELDNIAPTVSLAITSGAGDCDTFTPGTPIEGTYAVVDDHFGWLALNVVPRHDAPSFMSPAPTTTIIHNTLSTMPLRRGYTAVPTTGESRDWILDTNLMKPCGYVIRFTAWDRTNVNSRGMSRHRSAHAGLCISNE